MAASPSVNRATHMTNILIGSVLLAVLCAAAPASAKEVQMICTNPKIAYVVSFDTETKVFKTTNTAIGSEITVRRVQDDADGVLVWTATSVFGGEREMLALFGAEKWMKYFYGNGSVQTDNCK